MNKSKINAIFETFAAHNVKPSTELHYQSTFELLIAVILSAQATDIGVNKATAKLFPIANTPEKIYALGVEGLKSYIKTIGLYNAKAENIIKTCRILIDEYKSNVPNQRADLEKLPGVGRKTANVILNTAFGEAVIAVDTHIFRVANRTGIAPGKNVRDVENNLMKSIPKPYQLDAHHWLILHGRYTCVARTPKCYECIIAKWCEFKPKTTVD